MRSEATFEVSRTKKKKEISHSKIVYLWILCVRCCLRLNVCLCVRCMCVCVCVCVRMYGRLHLSVFTYAPLSASAPIRNFSLFFQLPIPLPCGRHKWKATYALKIDSRAFPIFVTSYFSLFLLVFKSES